MLLSLVVKTYNSFLLSLPSDKIGTAKKFLKENTEITASIYDGDVLNIKLPTFINLTIAETEPGVRGDTAKGGTKNAKLETGATVQVPFFISTGAVIKIDTRTGAYAGRA